MFFKLSIMSYCDSSIQNVVQILSTGIHICEKTVQDIVNLHKQSDQILYCLSFNLHLLDALLLCKINMYHY